MIDVILLRLDAPLISFGAPIVDNHGFVQPYPAKSLIVGLLANALGYDHRDYLKIEKLQNNMQYAVRCDKKGEPLKDFQTVFLGQPHLLETGWTTGGYREDRKGGTASKGTHIRHRHFRADSIFTVAVTLENASLAPALDEIENALKLPARPLFLGRKNCIPSCPIFLDRTQAESLLEAVLIAPALPENRNATLPGEFIELWWPDEHEEHSKQARKLAVTDERDWLNQIHCGRRFIFHGRMKMKGTNHE